jgi:transcriptional regulator with XRE-family HTH domain
MSKIARSFKLKRKNLSLTQSEFSKVLGIAQGYLSEIENGVKTPSDTLTLLFESLDKTLVDQNFKKKYLELAEEHMELLSQHFLLKEQLASFESADSTLRKAINEYKS